MSLESHDSDRFLQLYAQPSEQTGYCLRGVLQDYDKHVTGRPHEPPPPFLWLVSLRDVISVGLCTTALFQACFR